MIRQAKQEDAAAVIDLMYTAIGGIIHTLAGTDDVGDALQVLEAFFREKGNRISFENVMVIEEEGRVIAFMLAYHGSQAEALDRPFLERLAAIGSTTRAIEREAREDEYYLDSVAVHADYQGRGIGSELLRLFEQQASELGHDKIMLLVDQENTSAKQLYVKRGFTEDGVVQVSGHLFYRMIKRLNGLNV
ncbi:GNAT family N-acetyltransferase [Paenibacillus eucommiae]|uniref:Ribosomal protein S18 acetylase RimI-like enzyme n=1 Tax=Paenibacillus eucommiae TaxID=1355755 RepID=A0ABS4J721_9BACL|nr:GNAT family N-acetyltransferase [Paenibacillus eucommiae]MBP1994901.1 ribosomal protein S18 acetylase RimI-like enzyme [Paenibacillus eucommiae]